MTSSALVLAHGGGLHEATLVGAPVLALAVFLLLERRARRREREPDADPSSTDRTPQD